MESSCFLEVFFYLRIEEQASYVHTGTAVLCVFWHSSHQCPRRPRRLFDRFRRLSDEWLDVTDKWESSYIAGTKAASSSHVVCRVTRL